MSTRNFEEYRAEVLEGLGATTEDIRNEASWRAKVLEALGAEYTDEDTRNFERYRLKVLENLSGGGSGGGGGSSDFSTAEVTITGTNYTFRGGNPNDEDIWALLKINNLYYYYYDVYLEEQQTIVYDVIFLGESGLIVINKTEGEVNISGDATISSDDYDYYITFTGDCTITIS